jgi:hypothetical protein
MFSLYNFRIFRQYYVQAIRKRFGVHWLESFSSHYYTILAWSWSSYFFEHFHVRREFPWQFIILTDSTIQSSCKYILLLAAVTVGFLLVSFVNILAPSSTSTVDTSQYTSSTILAVTNTTIVQSWCISNKFSVLQTSSSSAIYTFCWSYIISYFLKILISLGISVSVFVVKFVMK